MRQEKNRLQKMRQEKKSTTENQKIKKIDHRKSKNQKNHLTRGHVSTLGGRVHP